MSERSRREERRERAVVDASDWVEQHASVGMMSLKLPEGASLIKIESDATRYFDIIPYVCGEGNPFCKSGRLWYERTYWTHRNVGPNQDTVCCPAMMLKEPCPVCEFLGAVRKAGPEDGETDKEFDKRCGDLRPKERQLWNVFDGTRSEDERKGVQVWDYSYHLFGKHLRSKIMRARPQDKYNLFADPEEGYTLAIGFSKESMGRYPFYDGYDIEFRRRERPIDEELLAQAYCLDDMPKILPYEELRRLFLALPSDKEDKDDAPRGRSTSRGVDVEGRDGRDRPREEPRRDRDEEERPARRSPRDEDKEEPRWDRDEDERPARRSLRDDDKPKEDERPARRSEREDKEEPRRGRDEDERPARRSEREDPKEDERPKGGRAKTAKEDKPKEDERPARRSSRDEDKPKEDERPRSGRAKTAKEAGLKVNDLVTYREVEYEIIRISNDGTSLTLETEDGKEVRGVAPGDVAPLTGATDEKEEPPSRSRR